MSDFYSNMKSAGQGAIGGMKDSYLGQGARYLGKMASPDVYGLNEEGEDENEFRYQTLVNMLNSGDDVKIKKAHEVVNQFKQSYGDTSTLSTEQKNDLLRKDEGGVLFNAFENDDALQDEKYDTEGKLNSDKLSNGDKGDRRNLEKWRGIGSSVGENALDIAALMPVGGAVGIGGRALMAANKGRIAQATGKTLKKVGDLASGREMGFGKMAAVDSAVLGTGATVAGVQNPDSTNPKEVGESNTNIAALGAGLAGIGAPLALRGAKKVKDGIVNLGKKVIGKEKVNAASKTLRDLKMDHADITETGNRVDVLSRRGGEAGKSGGIAALPLAKQKEITKKYKYHDEGSKKHKAAREAGWGATTTASMNAIDEYGKHGKKGGELIGNELKSPANTANDIYMKSQKDQADKYERLLRRSDTAGEGGVKIQMSDAFYNKQMIVELKRVGKEIDTAMSGKTHEVDLDYMGGMKDKISEIIGVLQQGGEMNMRSAHKIIKSINDLTGKGSKGKNYPLIQFRDKIYEKLNEFDPKIKWGDRLKARNKNYAQAKFKDFDYNPEYSKLKYAGKKPEDAANELVKAFRHSDPLRRDEAIRNLERVFGEKGVDDIVNNLVANKKWNVGKHIVNGIMEGNAGSLKAFERASLGNKEFLKHQVKQEIFESALRNNAIDDAAEGLGSTKSLNAPAAISEMLGRLSKLDDSIINSSMKKDFNTLKGMMDDMRKGVDDINPITTMENFRGAMADAVNKFQFTWLWLRGNKKQDFMNLASIMVSRNFTRRVVQGQLHGKEADAGVALMNALTSDPKNAVAVLNGDATPKAVEALSKELMASQSMALRALRSGATAGLSTLDDGKRSENYNE